VRPPPVTLSGRAPQLAELEAALERLRGGHPWVVQLIGEPGIGKSRLLAELTQRAEARGFLVLDGRAAEFEQDVPFGPIIDALNDYLGSEQAAVVRGLEPWAVQELAEVFPSLSNLVQDSPESRRQAARYRFHYAVRAALERLAARRRVLLTLDDIHWADPATFDVIAHLLRRFRGPFLMALALRHTPGRLAGAFEEAARAGFGTRLDLTPLSPSEARQLIDPALDARAQAELYEESGGNPFYLEQLVRARRRQSPTTVVPDPTPEPWSVPTPVLAAVNDELDRVRRKSRLVLDAAAIVGDSFEPELVAEIAELSVAATLAGVDELLEADIIRASGRSRRFRFRHPIVRRAVYDGMRPGWRLGAHARAAAALMAVHAPAGACAHHVERSAMPGDEHAMELLVDAARGVTGRAPFTAGRWLLAALRLLAGDADPHQRLELLLEAAAALSSGGAYEEAIAALEQALLLVPNHELTMRADVIAQLAYARRRGGRPFASRGLLESTLESLGGRRCSASANLRLELAFHRYWHDELDALADLAEQVLRAGREEADLAIITLGAALSSLAFAESSAPRALAALAEAEEAFAALPEEQLAQRVYVSFYIGMAELRIERADQGFAHAQRGLDVARMTGQGVTVSPWLAVVSQALVLKGQPGEASRYGHEAIDAARLIADDWRTVWALEADALAAFWAGDTDRALASAQEMVARAARGHPFLSGPAAVQLAGAEYAAGNPASATARLSLLDDEPQRRLLDRHAAHGWELFVRAQLALGETGRAHETAARAVRRAEAVGLPQQTATARCAHAAVLLARGEPDAVPEILSEPTALAEAAGNPLLSARARALTGIALAARGQKEPAIAELEHAERTLSMCGAAREADAAARELRRLGHRVPRRVRTPDRHAGLAALSPREYEVAARVAAGKTNREVAESLFLSEKTVGNHLARIFDKLDLRSRAALAALISREAAARSVPAPGDTGRR